MSLITRYQLDAVEPFTDFDRINNHLVRSKKEGLDEATLVFSEQAIPTNSFINR